MKPNNAPPINPESYPETVNTDFIEPTNHNVQRLLGYAAATLATAALAVGAWAGESANASALSSKTINQIGHTATGYNIKAPEGVEKPVYYVPAKKSPAILMTIHGGAWLYAGSSYGGASAQQQIAPQAERWAQAGFEVVNIDYGQAARALPDVESQYRQLAAQDKRPICLYGQSAGGNLALLAARNNPSVKCVISEAGPTDIPALGRHKSATARSLHDGAVKMFGTQGIVTMSPALQPWSKRTPILLAGATNDQTVPYSQVSSMYKRTPWAVKKSLPSGSAQWVHSKVDTRKLNLLNASEVRFVKMSIARK